jgi:hypothetical protein
MKQRFLILFTSAVLSFNSFSCVSGERKEIFEISSMDKQRKICIKKLSWGLTGDNQLTVISNSPSTITEPVDTSENYVFEGLQPFIWEIRNDSILIYTKTPVKVPSKFDKQGFILIQKNVNSEEFQGLLIEAHAGSKTLKDL